MVKWKQNKTFLFPTDKNKRKKKTHKDSAPATGYLDGQDGVVGSHGSACAEFE